MKKFAILFIMLIILGLFQSVFAESSELKKDGIRTEIAKVQKEIKRLLDKVNMVSSEKERAAIVSLIAGHEARVDKLKKQLVELAIQEDAIAEAGSVITEEVYSVTEEAIIQPETKTKQKSPPRLKFEIGALAGLFGNAMGATGELRFPLRFVLGPATTSLRIAGGVVQTEDMSRKYAPVLVDWIFNYPSGVITGLENYVGVGLNYVVLTTRRVSGAPGGQIFYGIDCRGFGGKVVVELGWAVLRTGFSSDYKGLSLMLGYRRDWGLF